MRRLLPLAITGLILIILSSCSFKKSIVKKKFSRYELSSEIDQLLDDPNIANAHVGILIEELEAGRVLYRKNEHRLFVPASNMKLFTTAAALRLLGPDFRFTTRFYINGAIEDSILHGDLIVQGSGDPAISGRFRDGDMTACFSDWADSLRQAGIDSIAGRLIGQTGYFKSGDILGDGWNWDDEPFWYSAQPSALAFNDNCIDVIVRPDSIPGPALFSVTPATDFVTVRNTAKTVARDEEKTISVTRARGSNQILIAGNIPTGSPDVVESITVEKPDMFFLTTLATVLRQKGVGLNKDFKPVVTDSVDSGSAPVLLFVHKSPPVSALVKTVNKVSHNFYAEQLLKTIGAEINHEGSFRSGSSAVKKWLTGMGVAPQEFIMVDGSGLSRKNMIAPAATVTLLRGMARSAQWPWFYESLPIAGVDGTIKSRMRGTLAQGNVHAKTGYVRHVRSLSGYVADKSGRKYIFSIMINHYSVPTAYVNLLQDRICILISNLEE